MLFVENKEFVINENIFPQINIPSAVERNNVLFYYFLKNSLKGF